MLELANSEMVWEAEKRQRLRQGGAPFLAPARTYRTIAAPLDIKLFSCGLSPVASNSLGVILCEGVDWVEPGPAQDDGDACVGLRVFVEGRGEGTVKGFRKARFGGSVRHRCISGIASQFRHRVCAILVSRTSVCDWPICVNCSVGVKRSTPSTWTQNPASSKCYACNGKVATRHAGCSDCRILSLRRLSSNHR